MRPLFHKPGAFGNILTPLPLRLRRRRLRTPQKPWRPSRPTSCRPRRPGRPQQPRPPDGGGLNHPTTGHGLLGGPRWRGRTQPLLQHQRDAQRLGDTRRPAWGARAVVGLPPPYPAPLSSSHGPDSDSHCLFGSGRSEIK